MKRNLKGLDAAAQPHRSLRSLQAWAPEMLGLMLLCVAFVAQASTAINQDAAADADGHVLVDNVSGSIRIQGWSEERVRVRGKLGEGAELLFQADGDRTSIRVVKQEGVRRMKASHLEIDLPQTSELTASGVSAEVVVEAVTGVQRLETVSGDVATETYGSELDVTTVSGDVRAVGRQQPSRVEMAAVSGDLTLRDVAGDIRMKTVSGDIELIDGGESSQVKANSTSGEIELEVALLPAGRLQAETISGDVEIQLLQTSDIDVDVESHSGRIENCLGETAERKQRYGPGRFLRFVRGDGDRRVRVETLSGSVDLCASKTR